MTTIGMIILLTGGVVYTVLPVLSFKLISIVLMITGYFIVKYSDKLNITLGGKHGRHLLKSRRAR